jgi:hypothetical protein
VEVSAHAPKCTEAEICEEYESQMNSLGGKTASPWKEWAAKITEQHNEATKDIVHQLGSNPHLQARNMSSYCKCIKKDMTWAVLNRIHMALIMISTVDHPATWKHNGVLMNMAAMEGWLQSSCNSNTILVDNIQTFITQCNG